MIMHRCIFVYFEYSTKLKSTCISAISGSIQYTKSRNIKMKKPEMLAAAPAKKVYGIIGEWKKIILASNSPRRKKKF